MICKISDEEINGYVATVLKLYLQLPETPSKANSYDRHTAVDLHARGLTLAAIESAFLLACARRLGRSPDMPPLSPIRSLAYFLPVIQEILDHPISDDYLGYLRMKVRLLSSRNRIPTKCG
jgi:hypothetical protein